MVKDFLLVKFVHNIFDDSSEILLLILEEEQIAKVKNYLESYGLFVTVSDHSLLEKQSLLVDLIEDILVKYVLKDDPSHQRILVLRKS